MNASVHAPELETSLGWLNTDRSLRFDGELRGQVVVLDFWTYCCINCIHILPDLAYLEQKYKSQPVTFVGVHSAKFANEASRETIRAAILRYEIDHPVVIDENMKIWRAFAARSWPTLVLIDAAGRVLTSVAGEGNRDALDSAIAEALAQGRANGTLAGGPLELRREANVRAASGLSFPGKVLADAGTNRLYVADSNYNRIIIADLPDEAGLCKVVKTVGSGRVGAGDGAADQSTFNHPQGMAVGQGNLYVADTENHLIRAIDLDSFEVTTIVGTGEMDNDRAGGMMGTAQGLNSPWDLALEGSTLYVAMAGIHQIWRIDLPVGFARAFAGSGRENIVDGPPESAALAQPSGICILGGCVYFADSEVSAVRGIDMALESVFTIIGEGLFSFGDVDGVFPVAKLQHPLGVDGWNQSLVVADTYNHKIKLVEPAARSVRSLFGSGHPGTIMEDGGAAFFEPGGLSVLGNDVYIADTNNHRIVRANLKTGAWVEIILEGLTHPSDGAPAASTSVRAAPIAVAPDRDIQLALNISLPDGGHINPEAPWSVRVEAEGRTIVQHTGKSASIPLTVIVPAQRVVTATTWHVMVGFAYCEKGDHGICIPAEMAWDVEITSGGDKDVVLHGAIDA